MAEDSNAPPGDEVEPDAGLGVEDPESPPNSDDIGEADFSIGPKAASYVTRPDDLFHQLKGYIESSQGGVFGLTGVRGAGKSVLLAKIEEEFRSKHHTLPIPAPVSSSQETAFFIMLFRQLCGSVVNYVNREIFKKGHA